MAKKLKNDWPIWVQRALQGVTFWIGHRRCLYRDYPLTEGALVAEICNLIYANLPRDLILNCEVQYTNLLEGKPKPDILMRRARADLVIAEKAHDKSDDPVAKFIIEVKRAKAQKAQIDADLRRLAAVRRTHPGIRAFMFVVAEAHRPKRFVNENGSSHKGKKLIPDSDGHFRVRRTWKAAHAYKNVETAQYACLLEVYGDAKVA